MAPAGSLALIKALRAHRQSEPRRPGAREGCGRRGSEGRSTRAGAGWFPAFGPSASLCRCWPYRVRTNPGLTAGCCINSPGGFHLSTRWNSSTRVPPGTWPKASDEADGNTGRPQPGFFRITGKKYFVPYRSQAKKYFVLYLRWLGEGNFLVQIYVVAR